MSRRWVNRWLRGAALVLSGGALFQTNGCSQELQTLVAQGAAGLITSIVNTFLVSYVNQLFGVGTGF